MVFISEGYGTDLFFSGVFSGVSGVFSLKNSGVFSGVFSESWKILEFFLRFFEKFQIIFGAFTVYTTAQRDLKGYSGLTLLHVITLHEIKDRSHFLTMVSADFLHFPKDCFIFSIFLFFPKYWSIFFRKIFDVFQNIDQGYST